MRFQSVSFLLLLLCFTQINAAGTVTAPIPGDSSTATAATQHQLLLNTYEAIKPYLSANQFGEPLYIISTVKGGVYSGEVYALLDHDFNGSVKDLLLPGSWCKVALLHLNVKACKSYLDGGSNARLVFYIGRKYYQSPQDANAVNYLFNAGQSSDDYIHLQLSSGQGPYGTSNYLVQFEALPVAGATLVHFSYSYESGMLARLALSTYLATAGSQKVGFSIRRYGEDKRPVYVKGIQGVIERNVMRYFLAIRSFLDTNSVPSPARLSARISRWYDLTQKYREQLHEIERSEYVEMKHQEYANARFN